MNGNSPHEMLDHSSRSGGPVPTEHKQQSWNRRAGDDETAPLHQREKAERGQRLGLAAQLREVFELGGVSVIELARRVINKIQGDNCLGHAAQLAYYFLFALFPFFLFLTALLAYLPIPNLMDQIMSLLAQALPGQALDLVRDNVGSLATEQRGGLLSLGILVSLWASSSAIVATTEALDRAYEVGEDRPWWKVRATAILLTIGFSLFIIAAIILLMFGPSLGSWLANAVSLGDVFEVTWNILRWPVIVMLMVVGLAILYYFAPDVEQEWRWVTPGAVFAALGFIIASLGFSYYVNNFASYNKTYGSIGAVIVLLTWMYLTGFFIIVGGEINAVIEHAAPSGKDPGEKIKDSD